MAVDSLRHLTVMSLVLIVAACSTSDAVRGFRAEQAKDFATARDAFRRELDTALCDDVNTDVTRVRVLLATYELGRMTGYTCDYDEAERLLREALRLGQLVPERYSHLTAILSELARLTFDAGNFVESVTFYERAIERLDRFQQENRDPIGFAIYLEDYAAALAQIGRSEDSSKALARAASLRSRNAGTRPLFIPVHYRDVCGKN